jgi:hypothetical protein
MQDQRANARDRVIFGARAELGAHSSMKCAVRDLSEASAGIEVDRFARIREEINLTMTRKGRSYLARVIWRETNRLRLAFRTMITNPGSSDLDARLRASEKKKRELQRRIKELIGES